MAELFVDELEESRAANPDRQFELKVTGSTQGHWDAQRLQQLLANLVSNALTHGSAGTPARVAIVGEQTHVQFWRRIPAPR